MVEYNYDQFDLFSSLPLLSTTLTWTHEAMRHCHGCISRFAIVAIGSKPQSSSRSQSYEVARSPHKAHGLHQVFAVCMRNLDELMSPFLTSPGVCNESKWQGPHQVPSHIGSIFACLLDPAIARQDGPQHSPPHCPAGRCTAPWHFRECTAWQIVHADGSCEPGLH